MSDDIEEFAADGGDCLTEREKQEIREFLKIRRKFKNFFEGVGFIGRITSYAAVYATTMYVLYETFWRPE